MQGYLQEEEKHIGIFARFSLGNEDKRNYYWRRKDEKICGICQRDVQTREHKNRDCIKEMRSSKSALQLLRSEKPDEGSVEM